MGLRLWENVFLPPHLIPNNQEVNTFLIKEKESTATLIIIKKYCINFIL